MYRIALIFFFCRQGSKSALLTRPNTIGVAIQKVRRTDVASFELRWFVDEDLPSTPVRCSLFVVQEWLRHGQIS